MNQLLENVINNPTARTEGALSMVAAQAVTDFLPWSSAS